MKIGNTDIDKLYVGETEVPAAYLGLAQVYGNVEPTPTGQPNNEIWYTTTDSQPINLTNRTGFGANYVSDTYSNGKGIIKFDGSINTIPASAFTSKGTLATISLPNGVVSIGNEAFRYCSGITTIDMSSVQTIGSYAFNRCSGITYIDIPNIITISDDAFARCMSASTVNLGSGLTSIGIEAFVNSSGLTSINYDGLKASWGSVSKGTDWNGNCPAYGVLCDDGTSLICTVSSNTMYYTTSNKNTVKPKNIPYFNDYSNNELWYNSYGGRGRLEFRFVITNIPGNAFSGFTTLETVFLTKSGGKIGVNAFKECPNLTSITYAGTINDWNSRTKGANWKLNSPISVVHCTDGDIIL